MPWTFSHPAAVLPLRRWCPRYLSFPALIVGSTMPDFGYYLPAATFATDAHSLPGLIEVCLPTGLLVLGVLCLMRKPLCFLLPQPHRDALRPVADAPIIWERNLLLRVSASLVLGAATHLVWDAFTHKRVLLGMHLALLQAPLFEVGGSVVPVYYMLQWFSTLAGAAFLLVAYRRWLRRVTGRAFQHNSAYEERWRLRLLKAISIIALAISAPMAVDVASHFEGAFVMAVFLRCIAVFGVVAFVLLVCTCSIYCYGRRGDNHRH